MSQINVNPPTERVVDTSGDRSAAAGINLITVLIVLAVLAVIVWFLFTGPLSGFGSSTSGGSTNINVNPPSQPSTINVNPPSAPAPGNSGSGTSGGESNPGRTP